MHVQLSKYVFVINILMMELIIRIESESISDVDVYEVITHASKSII